MKIFVRLWRQFCAIYTVSALLLLLSNLAMAGSLERTLINAGAFLLLFLFALLFAGANLLMGVVRIPYLARVLLHFVLVAGGGFCLLYLPYNAAAASSSKLIILILMMLLYWIPMGIYLAVFRRFSAKAQRADAEPYRSVYGASRGK
jgi:hypothetical protein